MKRSRILLIGLVLMMAVTGLAELGGTVFGTDGWTWNEAGWTWNEARASWS